MGKKLSAEQRDRKSLVQITCNNCPVGGPRLFPTDPDTSYKIIRRICMTDPKKKLSDLDEEIRKYFNRQKIPKQEEIRIVVLRPATPLPVWEPIQQLDLVVPHQQLQLLNVAPHPYCND